MFFIHLSPGMCGTPEQTLTSHWASSSTLKRLNPLCSPRRPSCWDWERLTNKYSTPWPVCTLARKHVHYICQKFSISSTPWTCCCETFCRASRGRSGLSHAGSVHAAHQAPPKGENVKQHCGWNRMHVRKMNAFSETCVLGLGGGVHHSREVCLLGEDGEWHGFRLHCQRATGAILLQSRSVNTLYPAQFQCTGVVESPLYFTGIQGYFIVP